MAHSDDHGSSSSGWTGRAILVVLVWVALASGAWFFLGRGGDAPKEQVGEGEPQTTEKRVDKKDAVRLGIAYGTEKRSWLKDALADFEKTEAAAGIDIDLIPMGSIEGSHAVLDGDERIHVWSPASSMYRDSFEQEWQLRNSTEAISGNTEPELALTPMVFVMWRDRYEAFIQAYKELSFKTISEALHAEGGWGTIAEKPEWGLFKFGHTRPDASNSGLMSLVLMAYDFHKKSSGLTVSDVVDPEFQSWLRATERAFKVRTNSTGNLMRDMILRGPSEYDGVVVYESVAIDHLKNAEGRWGELFVVYPAINLWNNNPYYALQTPWVEAHHQEAAKTFREFLMSEPIQKKALVHGFRPGNVNVPIKFPESPFVRYGKYGVLIDVQITAEYPAGAVLQNLQQTAQLIFASQ